MSLTLRSVIIIGGLLARHGFGGGDLIMPVVGLVFGKLDFSNMFIALGKVPEGTAMTLEAVKKAGCLCLPTATSSPWR